MTDWATVPAMEPCESSRRCCEPDRQARTGESRPRRRLPLGRGIAIAAGASPMECTHRRPSNRDNNRTYSFFSLACTGFVLSV